MAGIKSLLHRSSENSKLHRRESNFDFTLNTGASCGSLSSTPLFPVRASISRMHPRMQTGDTVGSSSFRLFDYPPSPLSSLFNYLARRERYYNIQSIYNWHTFGILRRISVFILFFFKSFFNFYETLQEFRLENYVII